MSLDGLPHDAAESGFTIAIHGASCPQPLWLVKGSSPDFSGQSAYRLIPLYIGEDAADAVDRMVIFVSSPCHFAGVRCMVSVHKERR